MMKIGYTLLMVTIKHLLTGVIIVLSLRYVTKVIVVVAGLSPLPQKLNLLTLSSMAPYTNFRNNTLLTVMINNLDAMVVIHNSL